MSYVKKTRIVENTWVCSSCQSKQLGRHMKCQSCGSAKEKDEKDIVPEAATAQTVTNPELLKKAKDGPDWECEYCNGRVRNAEGQCSNCAATRAALQKDAEAIAGDWKRVGDDLRSVLPPSPGSAPPPPRAAYRPPPIPKDPAPWPLILGLGGAMLVLGLITLLLIPREVNASISGISWVYTADLRQKTQKHGTDWGSPSESSAFNVSCNKKYYGDEDCHPHDCRPHSESYECNCTSEECNCHESCSSNGNGFSTCTTRCSTCRSCSTCSRTVYDTCYDQCPVYKNWCEYDYYAWPVISTNQTAGTTHEVKWPDLAANGPDQRLDRTEKYKVAFTDGKDNWTHTPWSYAEFQKFSTGETWKLKVRRIGSVEPLEKVSENTRPR